MKPLLQWVQQDWTHSSLVPDLPTHCQLWRMVKGSQPQTPVLFPRHSTHQSNPSSPTYESTMRYGLQAKALPALQTLMPAEHNSWVNGTVAFFSGLSLCVKAETNAGRIPAFCHSTINSSKQQCTQLRCLTWRNVPSNNKDEHSPKHRWDGSISNIWDLLTHKKEFH